MSQPLDAINSSLTKTHNLRRSFLKKTLAGGVVAALSPSSLAMGSTTEMSCETSSAGESLLMYLGMVNLLVTEAFTGIHRRLVAQLQSCELLYRQLYKLLNDLCAELSRTQQLTSQAEKLRELVKAGQTNAQVIKTSMNSGQPNAALALTTVAFLSQEVCIQAQTLLPRDSEAKLSKTATDILRSIFDLINQPDFKRLYANGPTTSSPQVTPTNDEGTMANELINNRLLKFIGEARGAIVEAENPHPVDENGKKRTVNRPDQWAAADRNLRAALETLKELVSPMRLVTANGEEVNRALVSTKLPAKFIDALPDIVMADNPLADVPNEDPDFTPADGLILTLGGTRRLIAKADYRRMSFDFRYSHDDEVKYISVAARPEPPAPVGRINAISSLLWSYCPPGYPSNATRCQAVVLFVNGWDTSIWEFVRIGTIRIALFGAERMGQIACTGGRNLGALARELARLG